MQEAYQTYEINLQNADEEFASAQEEINDAYEELSNISYPQWYIQGRESLSGYSELEEDIEKVELIAGILPIFFMLIAALMSLNTMTRMIEEERGELGILASLGYGKGKILWMYLLYVLIASIIGVISGFFVGCRLIPEIVYSCYQANYILPALQIKYDVGTLTIILVCALGLMMAVTIGVCLRELKNAPATLLRPLPPKKGQAIFLEKISFLWKRFSFIWKVTLRNIFRYKKRVFMTIVGISGCTAILLTGFGIRDSIDGIAQLQYNDIFQYDSLIYLTEEETELTTGLQDMLLSEGIENPLLLYQSTFICEGNTGKPQNVYLVVPEKEKLFKQYFNLTDVITENNLDLPDDCVVITQKLADLLSLDVDSEFQIRDTEGNVYTLSVGAITKNYIMHYIYMTPSLYEKIFREDIKYNIIAADYEGDENALAETLIEKDLASYISFTTDGLETFNNLVGSLNQIIVLIIAASSLLALIVLYNLVSINISERRREIATLKVLGFYNLEINEYIYRETFLLTLLSIILGIGFGVFLHRLVIYIIEVQSTVFIKQIGGWSYCWVVLIMLCFTVLIQLVTYFKLKKIDMIESLKSVE